ncbi:MAG: hypothetical protein NXI31_06755 [bacterium]|nr:hypothetical protein [bacterium]
MQLSDNDQRLLQKYRDGELAGSEAEALKARLSNEPGLAAGLAELDELARGFVSGREATFAAPAGFTAGLLAEVRQLPDRIQMAEAEVAGSALVMCRRLLLAAAVLFGLGLCWHAGLFDNGRNETLEADPAEVQREMERLDELVRSRKR